MENLPMEWFFDVPVVTRTWTAAIIATALLEHLGVVNRAQLMFDWNQIIKNHEYWRIITAFTNFGPVSIQTAMNLFFVTRNSRMLEESYRTRDYIWIWVLIASSLIAVSSVLPGMNSLGVYFAHSLLYIWGRRNPNIEVAVMGVLTMNAPHVPWVYVLWILMFEGLTRVKGYIVSTIIGHVIFFFEDVYPRMHNGQRPLALPWFFEEVELDNHENENENEPQDEQINDPNAENENTQEQVDDENENENQNQNADD